MKGKNKERTITGVVIPAEWDDDDNITKVAIQTEDFDEYLVEYSGKGKDLSAFIDYNIEVTGTVKRLADGESTINVKKYQALEEEYEEEVYDGSLDDDDDYFDKRQEDEW